MGPNTLVKHDSRGMISMKEKPNGLQKLIEDIYKEFEGDEVCIENVKNLMTSYKSSIADWKKFAKFDRYRYTRNLVDDGNGKFNLMVLCWGEGHGSAIHDHSGAHCFMKMLQGTLSEVRFEWPGAEENTAEPGTAPRMKEIGRTDIETNDVCYINDSMGLHRVENPSHADTAVSLHLYSPPFDSCRVFNQNTGHSSRAIVTFWSKFGQSRDKKIQSSRAPEDN